MKKILFLLFLCLGLGGLHAQDSDKQLLLHSFRDVRSTGDLENLLHRFVPNWPKGMNGEDCALVRVSFENMAMADVKDVAFVFGGGLAQLMKVDYHTEDLQQVWLFVTPAGNAYMEARGDRYGYSNRLSDLVLKENHVYEVVLRNRKTVSITVVTKLPGVEAKLETGQQAEKGVITDVPLGRHTLTLSKDGRILKEDHIEVSTENIFFEYDLRPTKPVRFISEPQAILYIDEEGKGLTPVTLNLPYDSYSVTVMLSSEEKETRSITVSDESPSEEYFYPVKKQEFSVFATYNGSAVEADLYINGNREKDAPKRMYTLEMPVGTSCVMEMTYYGNSKRRIIKVKDNMRILQEFKIPAKKHSVSPWKRSFEARPGGFSFGYTAKQLETTGEGEMLRENGVWDDGAGKWLHGAQIGFHFQPAFSFGLGLYLGIFYELYMSYNDNYDGLNYADKFQEHCVYVPVHAYFQIPFAEKCALSFHGGVGVSYSVYGEYSFSQDKSYVVSDFYGDPAFPRKLNLTGEIGGGLRFGAIQLNAMYSFGILDHGSYADQGKYRTVQNRMTFGISYLFGGR